MSLSDATIVENKFAAQQHGYVSTAEVVPTAMAPGTSVTTRTPSITHSASAPSITHSAWAVSGPCDVAVEWLLLPTLCAGTIGGLRHFNQPSQLQRVLDHCDFHSVPLPELKNAFETLRHAQSVWEEAIRQQQSASTLDDFTEGVYADVDYPARPRNYSAAVVRVDPPNTTRVKRIFTDDDAEVWGP